MPEKAIDSTEIIPFDPKNAPDHWHDGPALPEPLYGGCLGKAIKKKIPYAHHYNPLLIRNHS